MHFSSENYTCLKKLHIDALKTNAPWETEQGVRWCTTVTFHGDVAASVQPPCSKGLKTRLHHSLRSPSHPRDQGVLHWWAGHVSSAPGEKSVFTTAIASALTLRVRLFCLPCASAIGYAHEILTFASALKPHQFPIYLSEHTGLNALCHQSDKIGLLPSGQLHSRGERRPVATGCSTIPPVIYKLEKHTSYSSVSLLTLQYILRRNAVQSKFSLGAFPSIYASENSVFLWGGSCNFYIIASQNRSTL